MAIGKLDRRITFIEPTTSVGDSNEDKITAWDDLASIPDVWAAKVQDSGNTLVESDRIVYSQTCTWLIRFRDDLTNQMRIVDEDGQVHQILGIQEMKESRKRYMNITTQIVDNVYWS